MKELTSIIVARDLTKRCKWTTIKGLNENEDGVFVSQRHGINSIGMFGTHDDIFADACNSVIKNNAVLFVLLYFGIHLHTAY